LLDGLLGHDGVSLPLHVTGATPADEYVLTFDPRRVLSLPSWPPLRRPRFLAIVASATLAASLARHGGRVDGFVVEGPTAGGHNAPPRGPLTLSGDGEPVYGPRDAVDLGRMREIGLPFWLAGSCGTVVTSGNDLRGVARLLDAGKPGYAAADVIAYLTEQSPHDGPNV